MDINIKKFHLNHLNEIVDSFTEFFTDWSKEEASQYLLQAHKQNPEYCFTALNEKKEILGAVFCKIGPYSNGYMLIIESLQVKKDFRKIGVGKKLMEKVINSARAANISRVGMLTPKKNNFPLTWYKKLGFKETGWIELTADPKGIKLPPV